MYSPWRSGRRRPARSEGGRVHPVGTPAVRLLGGDAADRPDHRQPGSQIDISETPRLYQAEY